MLHRCDKCSILATDNLATIKSPFLDFKAYDSYSTSFGGLIAPSEVMLAYTTALEDLFVAFFKSLKQTKNIAQSLMKNLHDIHLDINCPHFDKTFLLQLFARMPIYYCLKFQKHNLSKSRRRKNRKYINVSHL